MTSNTRTKKTKDYYKQKLSAIKLKKCYDIAPPRVQQYFKAEINHVLKKINPQDVVLDLGCGFGRIFPDISKRAKFIIGIDTSKPSLILARQLHEVIQNISVIRMNAAILGFRKNTFNTVLCIQNGISAFHVDPRTLIRESIRVVKLNGTVLFSTYSEKFWNYRLEWFQLQSEAGLLGEIDYSKTGNGNIICKDGFTATTVRKEDFLSLTSDLSVSAKIEEVDESSLFCEIKIPKYRKKIFK